MLVVSSRVMNPETAQSYTDKRCISVWKKIGSFFIERAYSVLILAALFCTLTTKLFHALRYDLFNEYLSWILSDIAFFLIIDVALALICFRWTRKGVVRTVVIFSALVCTWSVMNAGWLIRTGTQILPRVLLPLFRSPINSFYMIGVNLAKMPKAAIFLLGPSAIALSFLFYALVKTRLPQYNRQRLLKRFMLFLVIVLSALIVRQVLPQRRSPQAASAGMQFNAQIKAVKSLLIHEYRPLPNPERRIPFYDQLPVKPSSQKAKLNLVLVVLEGIQYQYTSLGDEKTNLTPYLKELAGQGVEFTNARSVLTHTTKALFALLTGRFPSASQDIAEAVPAVRPYASLATILSDKFDYKTAFFQSAKGNFECRPGLVYNMGFQNFRSREDLNDPNCFVGYLGSDEFSMLQPLVKWMQADNRPFFVTFLCSVTHDPYEIPTWFGTPEKEPFGRYKQAISYTDKFLAALDVEIKKLNLSDETIFCVIGDHGEAFGEHGLLGHERISFEEVLHIPFCIRAPFLIEPQKKITGNVSSVDLVPTLLDLLGIEIEKAEFDGINALKPIDEKRKVFFAGWMQEGPAGYIQGNHKYIYDPTYKITYVHDLDTDRKEMVRLEVTDARAKEIADVIVQWRKDTIFRIEQKQSGSKVLFDKWNCRWTQRVSSAKLLPEHQY